MHNGPVVHTELFPLVIIRITQRHEAYWKRLLLLLLCFWSTVEAVCVFFTAQNVMLAQCDSWRLGLCSNSLTFKQKCHSVRSIHCGDLSRFWALNTVVLFNTVWLWAVQVTWHVENPHVHKFVHMFSLSRLCLGIGFGISHRSLYLPRCHFAKCFLQNDASLDNVA